MTAWRRAPDRSRRHGLPLPSHPLGTGEYVRDVLCWNLGPSTRVWLPWYRFTPSVTGGPGRCLSGEAVQSLLAGQTSLPSFRLFSVKLPSLARQVPRHLTALARSLSADGVDGIWELPSVLRMCAGDVRGSFLHMCRRVRVIR